MKPMFLIISAIFALSTLATFAVPPATVDRESGPNRLTEDRAAIERNLKEANGKLTAITRKLAAKLPEPEAKAFVKAQASWTAWRDANAEYWAHRYAPTNASSPEIVSLAFDVIVSANKIAPTNSRIKELEGELSSRCPGNS